MTKDQIKNLPDNPGVYIMYNSENTVIYVGKAKNLKNRVSQYFHKSGNHTSKVLAMISNIDHFEYIITSTEFEALVLECNLIKQYMPKYNILLKDDKSHPYIKITLNEDFPRIFLAHKMVNDGVKYFGPYLSSRTINEIIDVIKTVFNVRSCSKKIIEGSSKMRPCLNYQIGRCAAPCAGYISSGEYRKLFDEIISFLDGNYSEIEEKIKGQMLYASENLEFEKAAKLRDKLNAVRRISNRQSAISTTQSNRDIVAFYRDNKTICFQIFFVRSGKIIGREHYIIKNGDEDGNSAVMTDFIKQYYGMNLNIPPEIVLQYNITDSELIERWLGEKAKSRVKITVPKRGDKLKLVSMAVENAREELKLHFMKYDIKMRKMSDIMLEMKETLGLEKAPVIIESYDISNISGTDSVGVMVVFENGVPKKSAYKKFNIRSTTAPDDYQSMKEVLYRRLSNGIEGEEGFTPLPDIIFLDGGKGQVSAVREITDFMKLDIPLFGLVKDDRHRTRGITTETEEIGIKRTSTLFKFLTEIQDEVHRFAIKTFKAKHKKTVFGSELTEIDGVGEKTRIALIKHFKTIKAIKEASANEILEVKGISKKTAQAIYSYYHNN